MYVRRKADSIVIIALYVDDLLIASSKTSELIAIKRQLTQQYEMEDMGEATFILGIDIKPRPSQPHHQHRADGVHQHTAQATRHGRQQSDVHTDGRRSSKRDAGSTRRV